MIKTIERYCACISPSGSEDEIREQIIGDIKNHATSWEVDETGNLTVFKKGAKASGLKILFSAHMDEIGFMIKYISDEGYLYFDLIGGIDRRVVAGRRVVIGGNRITGVIASKAIHLQKPDEKGICVPISEMYIDIGCTDKESASGCVSVGDIAVFKPNFEHFGDGLIKSKAIDDRFGCAVLVELIKRELPYDTYFAFVTCEEVGTDGAKQVGYRLKPDIAVVFESTTAGDIADAPKSRYACSLRSGPVLSHMDGGTIYDKALLQYIKNVAEENNIEYQIKNVIAGGNDSSAYQKSGIGTRVAVISAPTRYIHSANNVVAETDLESIRELASALLERGFINA